MNIFLFEILFYTMVSFRFQKRMNIDKNDEDAEHYDRSMVNEANRAIAQIKFGVEDAVVSAELENSQLVAHINIRTLEKLDYCVELTMKGYMVVAERFDTVDSELVKENLNAVKIYETVDSLMLALSPMYGDRFNNSLADKLNRLASMPRD